MSPTKRGTLAQGTAVRLHGVLHHLDAAMADLDPPFAVVDLDAFDANAADLLRRAGGKRVRLASKSVRCRALIDRALGAGLTGILAFTLPEALWLDRDDVVVAYPTVDRSALASLTDRVTLMVDSREHLDLIADGRVSIDVDAGWWPLGGRAADRRQALPAAHAGAGRGPRARDRGPRAGARRADALRGADRRRRRGGAARTRGARDEAGVGARARRPPRGRRGGGERRRAAAVRQRRRHRLGRGHGGRARGDRGGRRLGPVRPRAVRRLPRVHAPARRVLRAAGGPPPVGRAWRPCSAAATRRPAPRAATVSPAPRCPACGSSRQEGAGEVQTPLHGPAAGGLRIGDRVWMRHAKAGELCERFDVLHLVQGGRRVATRAYVSRRGPSVPLIQAFSNRPAGSSSARTAWNVSHSG